MPKTNKVQVQKVKAGDFVYPSENWEAYSASLQARIQLDINTGYKVQKQLTGSWLHLEPGVGMATTVVYVMFKDPKELVAMWRPLAKGSKQKKRSA